ncbi:MAG: hypothetical protein QM713_06205 [Arachnia sp.]
MRSLLARDNLTIIVDGEEKRGIIAYGLIAPGAWREAADAGSIQMGQL